ncbi:NlpC/P60 family protein [Heliophilum fasciatum]|uniref:NlpC/P60 family protein n=1 Tax=Heliophilum fasciatum TaxID=35700 RepID=UPI003872B514
MLAVCSHNQGIDRIGHVGIYLGEGKMLHASGAAVGVTISDITTPYYEKTFMRAQRVIQ